MRYEDEEADASRSPGFVMAADAKTINPNVKVSILRWGCPNWVNAYKGTDWYAANYKWYKETIFDAYEKYGYVVDYINPTRTRPAILTAGSSNISPTPLPTRRISRNILPRRPSRPTAASRSWPRMRTRV